MENLREEFEAWLSNETWNWTTYATLTFSRPMRKDALRFGRAWARYVARTAPKLWGFIFQEAHSDGQCLHLHVLFSVTRNLVGEPTNKDMWLWWFRKFGRALVVDVRKRPKRNHSPTSQSHQKIHKEFITPLASYLTKYMVKETYSDTFDWDFYAFADGFELTSDEFHRYQGVNPTFLPLLPAGGPHGIF